jgi:hypothetical protein
MCTQPHTETRSLPHVATKRLQEMAEQLQRTRTRLRQVPVHIIMSRLDSVIALLPELGALTHACFINHIANKPNCTGQAEATASQC